MFSPQAKKCTKT